MRIYVEMMEAVKDEETGVAEALVLQRELEITPRILRTFQRPAHGEANQWAYPTKPNQNSVNK